MNLRQLRILVAGLWTVAGLGNAWAEFQVNTYTTSVQEEPRVALDALGNFVVVWESYAQDGSAEGIFGRRFDASGFPTGPDFQVNTDTTGDQSAAAVAVGVAGSVVVVWNGQDADGSGIRGQRYDNTGAPAGGEFQVNSYTTDTQSGASVAKDAAGNFVVMWMSREQDGDGSGIFARRFNSAGVPFGPDFQVNVVTTGEQTPGGIAATPAGNFVVTWSTIQNGYGYILGRRYDSAGLPLGGEFQVNANTTVDPFGGSVAVGSAGDFVVTWTVGDSLFTDIVARRFDSTGSPLGSEFQVNTYTPRAQRRPKVAMDPTGGFLIVWAGFDESGATETSGQRYDAAGGPMGSEFQVNTYTTDGQIVGGVAFDAFGNFVVTWTSDGQDGNAGGVFAQSNKPDWRIRGKALRLSNPSGDELRRGVLVLGSEKDTEIGRFLDGNPTVDGATLRVIANGATPSDQTFVLDASGWETRGPAYFKYQGPTGADGDPVRRLSIKRTPSGTIRMKAILTGGTGTQNLDVVPPNPGDAGGIILQFANGGGTYCVGFGGAAGGTQTQDDARTYRIIRPVADGNCPTP